MAGRAQLALLLLAALVPAAAGGLPAGAGGSGREAVPTIRPPLNGAPRPPNWVATAVPGGAANPLARGGWLISVSCPKPEICVAFGGYGGESGNSLGLVARLQDGFWRARQAPTTGLGPPARAGHEGFLPAGLQCPTISTCVAVGSYTSEGGALEGLVETEAGGQWSAHTAVLAGLRPEAGADPHLLFKDLACPHAGYCAALATYEDTGHQAHDFLEVFSDGKWSAVQAPLGDIAPAPAPGA